MGMSIVIQYPDTPPSWSAIRQGLIEKGVTPLMRMINGELSYPDEDPPENWGELRISIGPGMISLRKGADTLECVVWGNADATLQEHWKLLADVCAVVGNGKIISG